jgi:hemolysin activation/secretion protein
MKPLLFVMKSLRAILPVILLQSVVDAAVSSAPNAGSLLQQVQPVAPAAEPQEQAQLSIVRDGGSALPSSDPFLVKTIRITGNTVFATDTLHALIAEAEGKTLTLPQLGERVARITEYYHSHGYALAQAVILAQVIENGVLVVDVIEARYGDITFNNLSRVKGSLLHSTLSSLEPGQPIEETELNHALSLLSEIPGVAVNATLKPGQAVGTADLSVDATRGRAMTGSITVDNYGDSSTGKERVSATVNFINPLHHGDVLSLSGLSSGRGTNYGRLAYDARVSGQGIRVGAAYSTLHYILGAPFAMLDAHGAAQSKSLWARIPLKRSRKFSLYAQLHYESLRLRDRIDAGPVRTDRHLSNATISLAGDVRDSVFGGGVTLWNLGWKPGRVAFDDDTARMADAVTTNTRGGFSKWNVNVSRLQRVGSKTGLYLAFAGQWTNANLDSSEKMIAGGPYTVRAHDVGAVSGDCGYFGTAEVRREIGFAWHTLWQGIAFIDHAELTINRSPWVVGLNRVSLSGAGVGLNCAIARNWSVRISLAARIGSVPALMTNAASSRGWIEISRGF